MFLMLAQAYALTLELPTTHVQDETITVTVAEANPRAPIVVMAGRQPQPGACVPNGPCLGVAVDTVRLVDVERADNTGELTLRVPLSLDPGLWHVQAITMPSTPVPLSPILTIEVIDGTLDPDQDGVSNRLEFWAGTPMDDPDADDDGVLDGDDLWPFTPSALTAWTPDDLVISDPAISLPDPEFDAIGNQVVWQDRDGLEVWLADMDPVTGTMSPLDGRGQLLAQDVVPISTAKNGPEWVQTSLGPMALYAKERRGIARIVAAPPSGLPWPTLNLGAGFGPIGSLDPSDTNPRVLYTDDFDAHSLITRLMPLPGSELHHPQPIFSPRWIAGRDELIGYIADADDVWQVAEVDPVTGAWTARTQSPYYKRSTFGWHAPEHGVEAFFTTIGPPGSEVSTAIEVYLADGSGGWRLHDIIHAPPSFPFIVSPEPLEVNGQSYISFLASKEPLNVNNGEAEVWLVDIDPSTHFARRLSDGSVPIMKDPEPIVYASGNPFVYYTEITAARDRVLHRCALGL